MPNRDKSAAPQPASLEARRDVAEGETRLRVRPASTKLILKRSKVARRMMVVEMRQSSWQREKRDGASGRDDESTACPGSPLVVDVAGEAEGSSRVQFAGCETFAHFRRIFLLGL